MSAELVGIDYPVEIIPPGLARGKAASELEVLVREHQVDAAMRVPGSHEPPVIETGSEVAAE